MFDQRRKRKAVLRAIGDNANTLAEIIEDPVYPRWWRDTLVIGASSSTIRGSRLRRFSRPLYLGEDGIIYRAVYKGSRHVDRAELKKRDLMGLEYVNDCLEAEIAKLRHRIKV